MFNPPSASHVIGIETAAKEETLVAILPAKSPSKILDSATLASHSRKRSGPPADEPVPMETVLTRPFRLVNGEPCPKRRKVVVSVLVRPCERARVHTKKRRKELTATVHQDAGGMQNLELNVENWMPQKPHQPVMADGFSFTEGLRKERLASVCSYHKIEAKKEYFHCLWEIDNAWKSDFFKKLPRRTRQQINGNYADITIPGPIFEGPLGTSWQAVAYPFGYRSNRREGLVAMAVRYFNGPDAQVSAGFQISLVPPSNYNYCGLQETIRDHCDKLQEANKRSNLFKRGKKGWVLRKFATRAQLDECKSTALVFVFSFCIYGRVQTHYRHRFSRDFKEAESSISSFMKRLWNNGTPAGKIRVEGKAGKTFRVHSSVLQLNAGGISNMAANHSPENRRSLVFPDMTEAVLKKVLEFCYTLQVTRLDRTPFELLLTAHRYGSAGLQALAEREIVRHIDLTSILDLCVWNDHLQSPFLAHFLGAFLLTNFEQVRTLPDYVTKLSDEQRSQFEAEYASQYDPTAATDADSDDVDDNSPAEFDSGMDSYGEDDDEENFGFQDDETDGALTDDLSDGERMPALLELGEEPEEPQALAMPNQLALDQAAVLANMFGAGFGEMDADAMDFILMLM
ncbi:uncharacterized protein LOC129590453 [Paramacrobiotus metropolitanus]|uniref:uncharacterized protein LOC129590453 n=1 Tax=Paramacrobiotus metropolitanus TaxID=2943436 RepID=UPI0024462650|nr:uncharacterized protein LOC129590453 [Paramacrobiotus metropolitanus]